MIFFTNKKHILFAIWGHSYEFEDNNNWDVIENFCKDFYKNHDIWYGTNIQIVNYINALNSLEFSLDGYLIYNPSAIDIYIKYNGKNILIESGNKIKCI